MKLATAMFSLEGPARERVMSLGRMIPEYDLTEKGLGRPHITAKFGLHTNDPYEVADAVRGFGPVPMVLGRVSTFRRPNGQPFDVLKVDVGGDRLRQLNAVLGRLPHTDTFTEYNPHVTIAYVKPGLGDEYARRLAPLALPVVGRHLVFSDADRRQTRISLGDVTEMADIPDAPVPTDEVAHAGSDGRRVAELLGEAKANGTLVMEHLVRRAVTRLIRDGATRSATGLFDANELLSLQKAIANTTATADLLGRARVRERMTHIEGNRTGVLSFAEPNAFVPFVSAPAPLPPLEAIDYFKGLMPSLGPINPTLFAAAQQKRAFTMAAKADEVLLEKIKQVILGRLETGQAVNTAPATIQALLDGAGVAVKNPQYCFLPGTLVEGDVIAASQARYNGPAVKIQTNDGRSVSVTVNHPILTTNGWKRAGDIQEGDDLVCHGNAIKSLGDSGSFLDVRELPESTTANNSSPVAVDSLVRGPSKRWAIDNQKTPARIEDVFKTLLAKTPAWLDVECPVCSLDFHGDAALFDGEIRRVGADWSLVSSLNAQRRKCGLEVGFKHGNIASPNSPGHGFGLLDSLGISPNNPASAILGYGDRLLSSGNLGVWSHSFPVGSMRIGKAADIDPSCFHTLDKSLGGDVQLGRNLAVSYPGLVSTNRVVKIERITFSGHVYDLQTKTGFIVADGIITSNCEMVFRTNMMEAYNQGAMQELRNPDTAEFFPAWQYLAITDGRARPSHAAKNGLLYKNEVDFADVRGTDISDVANCRCNFRAIDKYELKDLMAKGRKIETSW